MTGPACARLGPRVAEAVVQGHDDVYAPRVLGPLPFGLGLVPRAVRDRVNRLLGADTVLLEVDAGARDAYQRRIVG